MNKTNNHSTELVIVFNEQIDAVEFIDIATVRHCTHIVDHFEVSDCKTQVQGCYINETYESIPHAVIVERPLSEQEYALIQAFGGHLIRA